MVTDTDLGGRLSIEEGTRSNDASALETMPAPRKPHKRGPDVVVGPVNQLHMLRCQTRWYALPDHMEQTDEDVALPSVPDMKKVEEDYNSVDYQILALNLWKTTAKDII